MKLVFTGGGTAGHIFPILAILQELKKVDKESKIDLSYIGPKDEYAHLLKEQGVKIKIILSGKIRRYFSFKNIIDLFKIPIGFLQALSWFFVKSPDLIFSKGGFGSFSAVLAGRVLHIPIFMHESDVVAGMVSKVTSKWALEIFTAFAEIEELPKGKIMHVGNPIRQGITNHDMASAKQSLEIKGGKPILLILGGSQGAMALKNIVMDILPEMLAQFEVIHMTGNKHYKQTKNEANVLISKELSSHYHLKGFLTEQELGSALAVSNLVISRAGSGAIFEISATGNPAILIPLPQSAQDHQLKNAYQFAETGAAEVLEQENLKPHFFLEKIKYLFSKPVILKNMAGHSKAFARPKATAIIANYIFEYLVQATKAEIKKEVPKKNENKERKTS